MEKQGILYIVATPIGNLKDITLRALEILKRVDLIACEDTRVTRKLLDRYKIKAPTTSLHQHSRERKIEELIEKLKKGDKIAYICDSGTPLISDPGSKLIQEALKYDKIRMVPVPGPSSLTAALSVSGAPSKNILFLGFLPHKKGRQTLFKEMKSELEKGKTIVFFESPHRIYKTIGQLQDTISEAKIVIARELTKKFEEIIHAELGKVDIKRIKPKGEFTVVVYPKF